MDTPAPWHFDSFESLDASHRETLHMLEEFDSLLTRVDTLGADPTARAMAAAIEAHFSGGMRRHHEDEEKHVFPQLAASPDETTRQTVARLIQDHAWLEADWGELQPLVDAIACGQSWYDLDTLRSGLEVLSALFREHIAIEEMLIYPQARMAMSPEELAAMDEEMAARRRQQQARRESRAASRARA